MGVLLKIATLVLAFFCLCVASSRRGDILHLDHLQRNMKQEIICGSTGRADPTKLGHVSGGRPETVSGGGDHNGGRSQPSGGAATMPLYTAGGAANDHHNNHQNHNGSSCNSNGVEFLTLAFTIMAYLLLRQSI